MKTRSQHLARLASLFLISLAGFAQNVPSLTGSYALLGIAKQADSFGDTGGAVLCILNFDGAGNVSGTAVLKDRTGDPQDADTGTGAVQGTYALNPDGSGSVNLQFTDFGFSAKLAMVVTDGGKNIHFADGPGSTGPLSLNPALQGSPDKVVGVLPAFFFLQGVQASGTISLTLNRTFNDGVSVYSLAAPATGSGPVTCPDGSSSNWSAIIPSATALMHNASGDFMISVLISACGRNNSTNYSGLANINFTSNAMNLVLHLTGFFITGSARPITGSAPQGVYGFQLLGEPFPNALVGTMTFDAAGGVTASFIGPQATTTFTGTYATNSDGSGVVTVTPDANPSAAPITFAFAAADNAATLFLLRTSGGAGGADVVSGIGHLK